VWRAEGIWKPFSGVTFPAYAAGYPENRMVAEIQGGGAGVLKPGCESAKMPGATSSNT